MAQTLNLGKVIGPKGDTGLTGAQGPIGQTGAKGDAGAQGIQGTQGLKGDIGAAGAKGADGATWLFGAVAPTTQGATGDFYINTATFDVYSKSTGAWVKTGNIKGATGVTGAAGAQGIQSGPGAKGDKGDQGATPTFSINASGELIATFN